MEENLNKHLEQISRLISGLREKDADLKKLVELDKSLDLLSHKLKTARLDIYTGELKPEKQGARQDAVLYFDKKFNIIRFVGAMENVFGRRNPERLPKISVIMAKEDFVQLKERTRLLWKTDEPQSFDSYIVSKNGIMLPVNILLEKVTFGESLEAVAAGLLFFNETPSDLEDYREILLENLPDIDVYLFDNQFRHVLTGGREKEKMKLSNADVTGKTLFEIFDEKTQKRLFPFYRNSLDGKVSEGEVRIKNEVYFVSATPVYGLNKQVVGGALISQNVTKEKEVEKNLIKAKREAEEADKAKSVFLANMSHEIRTPLNAIVGFTGLLNKTGLTPQQKKFSELISKSSEHLLSVVNEVLFLFKLGMGKVFIEEVPFNTRELVQNVKESLRFRADEKKLGFQFIVDKAVPKVVIGDPFRMKQILINLTSNSLKFTDEGKVSVRVFIEKSTSKKVYLRFEVEDTGIGISKEDLDTIFDEFAQPGIKNKTMRKGAGLGLTIVRKLVELLNGRMHVESELGKGSEFTVVIPFVKAKKSDKVEKPKQYDLNFNLLRDKRILYADDDENNLLLAEAILSGWEIDFEIARDGAEALQWLEKDTFDVVLLDIHMPYFSGVEVVEKIRRNTENANRHVKMLAVTANVMEKDLEKYLGSGFDDYILKPFREDKLYNKICNLLDIEVQEIKSVEKETEDETTENETDHFDTSDLMKTTGGNVAFFNQMIDTFVTNAKDTSKSIRRLAEEDNWEEVGQRAHKAIPSFRYFKLHNLVNDLTRLEELGLHQKNFAPMPPLAQKSAAAIDTLIEEAKNYKLEE